jgi:acyl-coenzyme A thioesterase PaaI-like protein
MADFLYRRDDDVYVPTEWAGSPWSTTSQHGGPINALFMRAAEVAAREAGMAVARLTIDLFKPVPHEPLTLVWSFARQGRRMAIVEASLAPASGERCCAATAVLAETNPALGTTWAEAPVKPAGPEGLPIQQMMPKAYRAAAPPGFHFSLKIRMKDGAAAAKVAARDEGPAVWISTDLDLCEGEPMTPGERCAAVADLTFGLSGRAMLRGGALGGEVQPSLFINTDTTLHFLRPPSGAWFAFADGAIRDHSGIGMANVQLHDEAGLLGQSAQTLVAKATPPELRGRMRE